MGFSYGYLLYELASYAQYTKLDVVKIDLRSLQCRSPAMAQYTKKTCMAMEAIRLGLFQSDVYI